MTTPPGESAARRRLQLLLRVAPNVVGIVLLGWFFHGLDMPGFSRALRSVQPGTVVGISAGAFLEAFAQGLLFYCLCPAGQSAWCHVRLVFALQTGNIVLPLRSGELIRPFYLNRWHPQSTYKTLVGFTLADKGLQVIAVFPYLLVGLYLFAADAQLSAALRQLGYVLGGIMVPVLLASALWVRRRLGHNLGEQAASISPRAWLGAGFWALLMWVGTYSMYYFAIGDAKVALALMVGVGFGSGIPSLPAGVGAYEATFLWVGERAHLPHDQVLVAAVVAHSVQILTTLAFGLPTLLFWGWPKRTGIEAAGTIGIPPAASGDSG